MRITHARDDARGTTVLTIEFPNDADPDRVADLAYEGVNTILERQARERGTVPDKLRKG